PTRVLRLSAGGARHVAGWWSGTPVSDNPKARALARRLLDTGIAHPAPDATQPAGGPAVTVVIPVRDRHAELARCLAGLAGAGTAEAGSAGAGPAGAPQVIVVDDGSDDQAAIKS